MASDKISMKSWHGTTPCVIITPSRMSRQFFVRSECELHREAVIKIARYLIHLFSFLCLQLSVTLWQYYHACGPLFPSHFASLLRLVHPMDDLSAQKLPYLSLSWLVNGLCCCPWSVNYTLTRVLTRLLVLLTIPWQRLTVACLVSSSRLTAGIVLGIHSVKST